MMISRSFFSVALFGTLALSLANCDDDGADPASASGDCNKKCQAANGEHWVCRASDRQCVSLLSEQCTTVRGDDTRDDAVIFGTLLTTTGPGAVIGKPIENSLVLALNEMGPTPLPPLKAGDARRPTVWVSCTDDNNAETAVKSAKHLVDVGAVAVVGTNSSGLTIKVANDVMIPNDVMLMSSASSANVISTLNDKGLVWRSVGATAQVTEQYAAHLRERYLVPR